MNIQQIAIAITGIHVLIICAVGIPVPEAGEALNDLGNRIEQKLSDILGEENGVTTNEIDDESTAPKDIPNNHGYNKNFDGKYIDEKGDIDFIANDDDEEGEYDDEDTDDDRDGHVNQDEDGEDNGLRKKREAEDAEISSQFIDKLADARVAAADSREVEMTPYEGDEQYSSEYQDYQTMGPISSQTPNSIPLGEEQQPTNSNWEEPMESFAPRWNKMSRVQYGEGDRRPVQPDINPDWHYPSGPEHPALHADRAAPQVTDIMTEEPVDISIQETPSNFANYQRNPVSIPASYHGGDYGKTKSGYSGRMVNTPLPEIRKASANRSPHYEDQVAVHGKRTPKYKHLGGVPRGPIAVKEKLVRKYDNYFAENPKVDLIWEEPRILGNCWLQAMLSTSYSFSPNCDETGNFSPKQCYLQR